MKLVVFSFLACAFALAAHAADPRAESYCAAQQESPEAEEFFASLFGPEYCQRSAEFHYLMLDFVAQPDVLGELGTEVADACREESQGPEVVWFCVESLVRGSDYETLQSQDFQDLPATEETRQLVQAKERELRTQYDVPSTVLYRGK